MTNIKLLKAKKQKNDEFYTLYEYIEKEIGAYLKYNPDTFKDKIVLCPCDNPERSNFTKFFVQNFIPLGLKKLICTSYYLETKEENGRIFTLTKKSEQGKQMNLASIEWEYLEGTGDFRSAEITILRNEADIIVTNPPFSLFREFITWILEADKKCLIIGQINMTMYKEIFPEIQKNHLWIGATCNCEDMIFEVPAGTNIKPKEREKAEKMGYWGNYIRMGNACWFTNMEHTIRHTPLILMSMSENLKYNKHKCIRENGYIPYYNYDGIDIPYVDAIPSDYKGIMGVPASFLTKYNPDQFELIDNGGSAPKSKQHIVNKLNDIIYYEENGKIVWSTIYTVDECKVGNALRLEKNGQPEKVVFGRVLIRKK